MRRIVGLSTLLVTGFLALTSAQAQAPLTNRLVGCHLLNGNADDMSGTGNNESFRTPRLPSTDPEFETVN